MAKLVILNWTGDRPNWGCQATSYGLLEDLREAMPGIQIEIATVPLGAKSLADRIISRAFPRFLAKCLSEPIFGRGRAILFSALVRAVHGADLQKVLEADAAIFMAEGTMSGKGFFGGLRLLMLPRWASKIGGKCVVSLNQTLFTPNPDFLPLLRECYDDFCWNAVREPASLSFANEHGIRIDALLPDSAFRTKPAEVPLPDLFAAPPTGRYLCITGSAAKRNAGSLPAVRAAMAWARDHDMAVCPLFWQDEELGVATNVATELGVALAIPRANLDYRQVSTILASAFALVGGRYHTCIQSAAVGTPFLALPSGTHKTDGLVQMLDWPIPIAGFEDEAAVRAALDRIARDETALRSQMADATKRLEDVRKQALIELGKALTPVLETESSTSVTTSSRIEPKCVQ